MSVPQFDPTLFGGATLLGVEFELEGDVSGNIRFENRGAMANMTTAKLEASIKLYDPFSSSTLVSVLPLAPVSEMVASYDGTKDWGGASGRTYTNLTDSDSQSTTLSSGLAPYVGSGLISLPVTATGKSSVTGGGNVSFLFETVASATAKVTYFYEDAVVPEPSTLVVWSLLGGMGLVYVKRRRRTVSVESSDSPANA